MIFLSYDRRDLEAARRFYQQLRQAGLDPWMDEKDIPPGALWRSSIHDAIKRADFFLACLSPNTLNRPASVLEEEWDVAQETYRGKPQDSSYIIPVLLESCDKPPRFHPFQHVDLQATGEFARLQSFIQGKTKQQAVPDPIPFHSLATNLRILLPGELVHPGYPTIRIPVLARLYAGNDISMVKKKTFEELAKLSPSLFVPTNHVIRYHGASPQLSYDLEFSLLGKPPLSSEHGFLAPHDWPFESEDMWLGKDITDHCSLEFTPNGVSIIIKKQEDLPRFSASPSPFSA